MSRPRSLRTRFAWINVVGGVAVLASYVIGLASNPELAGAVWGGVPEALQPLYTVCMFLAAGGYFLFSYYVYFGLPSEGVRVFGREGFVVWNGIYAAILIPSAFWMPLTLQMISEPSTAVWGAIRLVLFTVGAASVVLIVALRSATPAGSPVGRALACLGAMFFAFQTAVLDALIWPAYFPH